MNHSPVRSLAFSAVLLTGIFGLSTAATADSGFYIGVGAGGATLEADINEPTIPELPSSIDEDDTGLKVFAGYTFDLPIVDIDIEAGYVDFGEPDIDIADEVLFVDTSGINVWGTAAFDVGPVQVFGKLGMIMWDVEAEFLDERITDDGTDIGYGAGVRFNLGPVQVRGEYELYDVEDADIAMLSLGVAYRF